MTKPVYKIETYTGETKDYTITEAKAIHTIERVTSSPGIFSFVLPTVKGAPNPYYYTDIAVHDLVKIYLGYDAAPETPTYVGRIQKISAPLNTPEGYVRIFTGKSQLEVSERRIKYHKKWDAVYASTLVTELANDLGLGTSQIETDTTGVTLTVGYGEPYLSLLSKLSDYWTAGGNIKKDFYVDVYNNLVWKSRPFRTSGVETLTVGGNIWSYNVFRDINSVKNKIKIMGDWTGGFPSDLDARTEQNDDETPIADGWSVIEPEGLLLSWESYWKKIGDESFEAHSPTSGSPITATFQNVFPSINCSPWNEARYTKFNFWLLSRHSGDGDPTYFEVRLYAPSWDNMWAQYFDAAHVSDPPQNNVWKRYELDLGPSGNWVVVAGSPGWDNVDGCYFDMDWPAGAAGIFLDGLHFQRRTTYIAQDTTSQNNYGVRDYTLIDNNLLTDSECETRAKTLLYQLKDPPIRIDITTQGNTNLLVGDRLSLTIPAEGITAQNYDTVEVEHIVVGNGFISRVSTVNTPDKRILPPLSQNEILKEQNRVYKMVAQGLKTVQ